MTSEHDVFRFTAYNMRQTDSISCHQDPYVDAVARVTGSESDEKQRIDQDKIAIYSHPLFPLLVLIFEKCELSTCASRHIHTMRSTPTASAAAGARCARDLATTTHGDDLCSSNSFNDEIRVYAEQLKTDGNSSVNNPDVDNLIIQAIQVLRFHALEIEKVHELCDSFCSRYINCLKGKIPPEFVEGHTMSAVTSSDLATHYHFFDCSPEDASCSLTSCSSRDFDNIDDINCILMQSMHQCHQREDQQPAALFLQKSVNINNNTKDCDHKHETGESLDCIRDMTSDGSTCKLSACKQRKRSVFPKLATTTLRAWLFQHLSHPYPSEDQKKSLSIQTDLTMSQVNNWFINARRRIVQPMIDQSNRTGSESFTTTKNTSFASRAAQLHQPPLPAVGEQPQPVEFYSDTAAGKPALVTADKIQHHQNSSLMFDNQAPGNSAERGYSAWINHKQQSTLASAYSESM